MKAIISTLIFIIISTTGFAQQASVEDRIFGLQLGLTSGISAYYEHKLNHSFALRTEVFTTWGYSKSLGFEINPAIALEPKYYYNLKKRKEKGKNIAKNSGNYLSLRSMYWKDPFYEDSRKHRMYLLPMWGMRRTIGEHFSYEFAAGGAYEIVPKGKDELGLSIDFRIGYTF
ncbi:hypothetical protein [Sediminitomix flava]|uniref:Outer membrane protein with beta-barrel domain n=1 Tax=Sediminitomix flava TaxID=379075 RepID=A0A315Z001_SEDFL|nr:hypothetical protein [Sediminitomix flava]PWJ36023.1 hypothetical protein BC781_10937 [Sediminitomix flava]